MENNENKVQGQEVETGTEEKTSYTKEEVEALLQAETDRRVTSALKKQEAKNQQKLKEAEKLAQMNEAQKFQYQLEQREAAIAEKERALALAENKAEAAKILGEKGIDLALVDFVVAEDADTMNMNINLLDKAFKNSVKKEVERRLGSSTPKRNLPLDQTITKEQFLKMSYTELMELKENNPDLYSQFTK